MSGSPKEDIESPSSRRAWIEIGWPECLAGSRRVALLAEGVDRNRPPMPPLLPRLQSPSSRRAWIEITTAWTSPICRCWSPSSRRAWIEIPKRSMRRAGPAPVALLAEGVDRNTKGTVIITSLKESPSSRRAWIEISARRSRRSGRWSPSSRRAWIEILSTTKEVTSNGVALLAEGVDRNHPAVCEG